MIGESPSGGRSTPVVRVAVKSRQFRGCEASQFALHCIGIGVFRKYTV